MKRILLIGDQSTGKTTFLNIILHKQVSSEYIPTMGIQAGAKTIQFNDRSFINLQIWDTPGQQRHRQMAYPFYANCKLFIVFLDRSQLQTLQGFQKWLDIIKQNNPGKVNNILVLLNKTSKKQIYNKVYFEQKYKKYFIGSLNNPFRIQFYQINILGQKDQIQQNFIKPILKQYVQDDIVIQTKQKYNKGGKCQDANCKPAAECNIM